MTSHLRDRFETFALISPDPFFTSMQRTHELETFRGRRVRRALECRVEHLHGVGGADDEDRLLAPRLQVVHVRQELGLEAVRGGGVCGILARSIRLASSSISSLIL